MKVTHLPHYAVAAFLAAGIIVSGCSKTENTGNGNPGNENTDFSFQTKELTQGSFSVEISPKDEEMTYYFGLISKEDYEKNYENENELINANIAYMEEAAASAGISLTELLMTALLSGKNTWEYLALTPDSEYLFYAYGFSTEAVPTTSVNFYEFTTPKVEFMDVTFKITAADLKPTSFTLKVEPDNGECFYYYDVMTAADYETYCGSSAANVPSFIETYLETLHSQDDYSAYTTAQFIAQVTNRGNISDSESFFNLLPEATYYAFAVGIANDGSAYTEATVVPVTTSETPKNEYTVSRESVSDVSYSAYVTASESETFAVMMERQMYFNDKEYTDAEIIQAMYAANGNDISEYLYAEYANVSFSRLIPNEAYYLLIFACSPDGTPKLEDGKVNLKKVSVQTSAAAMSSAEFSLKVYDITKTSATLNVYADSKYSAETFLFNIITKAEYDELSGNVGSNYTDMDEALQSHMNEFIDANHKAWNESKPNAQMDRKEFLSRSLMDEAGITSNYDLTDLSAGEDYYVYLFGLKADGTYTTAAVTKEFTTIPDEQSLASLSFGVTATNQPDQERVHYGVYAYPTNAASHYVIFFVGNDELSGMTSSEVIEKLKKDGTKWGGFSSNKGGYVPYGSSWYYYAVAYDENDIATDVYKISHSVPAAGENGNVDVEATVVSDTKASASALSIIPASDKGLTCPPVKAARPAVELKKLDPSDVRSFGLRRL